MLQVGLENINKMSLSIRRSIIEQFSFNGKSVRSVHVNGEECLISRDVYEAVGYDRKAGVQAIQRYVPEKYKLRLGDALSKLEGVLESEYTQPNTVLLKEPGLYCFLLRCKKPKVEPFMDWVCEEVLPREVRKLAAEIEEKNAQLAESQDLVRQLEFDNVGLQGEITAMDREIERRREENADLIANRHVPRREEIDNVLCFIDKNSDEQHQFYVIRCQKRALEKHRRCLRNRYPNMIILGECDDPNSIHRWNRFKSDSVYDFYRNHFSLDREARELFETAFDIAV